MSVNKQIPFLMSRGVRGGESVCRRIDFIKLEPVNGILHDLSDLGYQAVKLFLDKGFNLGDGCFDELIPID